ncbi:hypothetical protein MTO96_011800 [Rhipicephalus appendiculatus]
MTKAESRKVATPPPPAAVNVAAMDAYPTTHHAFVEKMRVKWNRNLDSGPSSSNAVGGKHPPQLGLFERRGSLHKPSAPDAAKEEPFKMSWSFRIGGSGGGSKTRDASAGGNDKSAFLRMFRFGKDKKAATRNPAGDACRTPR